MTTRTFQARISELDAMMTWIRGVLASSSLKPGDAKKLELALEEALINIIQYAYPGPSGLIEVVCAADEKKNEFYCILTDQGVPFNPLCNKHELDTTSSLTDRRIGGLGLHLMQQMTDRITYSREGDSNILVLAKSL